MELGMLAWVMNVERCMVQSFATNELRSLNFSEKSAKLIIGYRSYPEHSTSPDR